MNFAELQEQRTDANLSTDTLILNLETALAKAPDHRALEPIILELAQLYLSQSFLDKAKKLYDQYVTLYPGGQNLPQVLYAQITILDQTQPRTGCDQSTTKELIAACSNFIKKYDHKTLPAKAVPGQSVPDLVTMERIQQVKTIKERAHQIIYEAQLDCITFYIRKYEIYEQTAALKSARSRFDELTTTVLPTLQNIPASYQEAQQKLERYEHEQSQTPGQ
jgi:hypothetical protein